jgi:molybdopterin synthase catalytic subunit
MRVSIIIFGILKDWLGNGASAVELPEGASVGDLLTVLGQREPRPPLEGIAVSVNAEYASSSQTLHEGDEVALLPPVSGGAPRAPRLCASDHGIGTASLTREPIDADRIVAAAKAGADGAVVVFDGIVRNHSRGRKTLYLDYEAYEEMALKQLEELARQARERFGVRHLTVAHRLGRIEIGETSVLIVVSSAHRAQAFDACRWLIDTLKQTVPIWKKETFADGAVWAAGEPFPDGIAVGGTGAER